MIGRSSIMPGAGAKREQNARDAARNNPRPYGQSNQGPARYDGPNDSPSRGRAASSAGSNRSASRGPYGRATSQNRKAQLDLARSMQRPREGINAAFLMRNVDFGGNAYNYDSNVSPDMPDRHSMCDGELSVREFATSPITSRVAAH